MFGFFLGFFFPEKVLALVAVHLPVVSVFFVSKRPDRTGTEIKLEQAVFVFRPRDRGRGEVGCFQQGKSAAVEF